MRCLVANHCSKEPCFLAGTHVKTPCSLNLGWTCDIQQPAGWDKGQPGPALDLTTQQLPLPLSEPCFLASWRVNEASLKNDVHVLSPRTSERKFL